MEMFDLTKEAINDGSWTGNLCSQMLKVTVTTYGEMDNGDFGFSDHKQMFVQDAGDAKGTARDILDQIAPLESKAEKSFMHRFNIASDLRSQDY